jgi:hypothetical protein
MRVPLGTGAHKMSAVVAVGELSPQERASHKKTSRAEPSEKTER